MTPPADIAEPQTRALVSPNADFWLVGGASLTVFAVFVIITEMFGVQFGNDPYYWAFFLSFLINDPHFMYSYFLFYRNFRERLASPGTEKISRLRYLTAGVLVPVGMTAFVILAVVAPQPHYLEWAVDAMLFTVGWHYVKQGYGVLITLSLYEGVYYSAVEKRILWLNAYALWIYSWLCGMFFGRHLVNPANFYTSSGGIAPNFTDKPAVYGLALMLPAIITVARHAIKGGGISVNAVTGYACATFVWLQMPFINPAFLALIPLFHSLQYLPFVYKMKKSELSRVERGYMMKNAMRRALVFTVTGIVLGAIFFEFLPKYLDHQEVGPRLKPTFFFLMFLSYINIHHYFMDSAYWRRDNEEVQRDLFRA